MSSFTLTNTAAEIASAIKRVKSADTEPTSGSGNMVTSGGVKDAIDVLAQGGINADALGESLDTVITSDATDLLIPTSKAVVDYVETKTPKITLVSFSGSVTRYNSSWNINTVGRVSNSIFFTYDGATTATQKRINVTYGNYYYRLFMDLNKYKDSSYRDRIYLNNTILLNDKTTYPSNLTGTLNNTSYIYMNIDPYDNGTTMSISNTLLYLRRTS